RPASSGVLEARQGAVRELRDQLDFRMRLTIQGALASRTKADPRRFVTWAETDSGLSAVAWARPFAWVLPPITLLLFILERVHVLDLPYFWLGVLAQLVIVGLTRKKLAASYQH